MKLFFLFYTLIAAQMTLTSIDLDERKKKPKPTIEPSTDDPKGYGETGDQPIARLKKIIVNCKDWLKDYARDYKKKDKLTALIDRYVNRLVC